MKLRTRWGWVLLGVVLWAFGEHRASAAYYNTQSYSGQGIGGPVANGTLRMSNNVSTVTAGFYKGPGSSFTDSLVMFIDTAPGVGITTTGGLTNKANTQQIVISGNGVQRSTANFAPDFEADYAIVVSVNYGSAIYKIVTDSTGPNLQLVRTITLAPPGEPNAPIYTWSFDWADIGLPRGNTNFFKFETSLVISSGSRMFQSFEGITGTSGFNTITFTNYDTYGVQPIPENAGVALAVFGGVAASVVLTTRLRLRRRLTARD